MKSSNINKAALFLVAVLVLLGLVAPSFAQQLSPDELIARARDAGFSQSVLAELQNRAENRRMDDQQLSAILQSVLHLAEDNLPAEHIIQKALEGLSKGVSESMIISHINTMRSSTAQAARVVDPWIRKEQVQQMLEREGGGEANADFRNNMIRVSSGAITQDIPAELVGQILEDVSDESVLSGTRPPNIVAAIGILSDLPAYEQSQGASAFVVRALKGGFNSDELQKLPAALRKAQQLSELPAASILEGVYDRMQVGIPARQILHNLLNGDIAKGPPGDIPNGL